MDSVEVPANAFAEVMYECAQLGIDMSAFAS
jgi:hypothetical protein